MQIISDRIALEQHPAFRAEEQHFRIIDRYKNESVGIFWKYPYDNGIYCFQLDDGRSRGGGYAKVLKSLKLMFRK